MKKVLLIMAGGKSTRTGFAQYVGPKFLLPICQTNLLFRQIEQAIHLGLKDIVISTSVQYFELVRFLTEKYFEKYEIRVIKNEAHDFGLISALANVVKLIDKNVYVIISLSDIVYSSNPFIIFNDDTEIITAGHNYGNANKVFIGGGTLEMTGDGIVKEFYEKADTVIGNNGAEWSGLFGCQINSLVDFENFIGPTESLKIGDYFSFVMKKYGYKIRFVDIGKFINNNSLKDLHDSSNLIEMNPC